MKIHILGCGWLGRAIGSHWVAQGHQVGGSTRQQAQFSFMERLGITPYQVVLSPREPIPDPFLSCDILMISIPPGRKKNGEDNYIDMMTRLHEAISGRIGKVLFISSTSVYPTNSTAVSENHADAKHKLVCAEEVFYKSDAYETSVVRFAGLVGPGRHPGKFLSGKQLKTDGQAPVNLIHQADCIGLLSAMVEQSAWSKVYNACAKHHPSKIEFYTKACKQLGVEPPYFMGGASDFKIVDSALIREELGYQFVFDDPMDMI